MPVYEPHLYMILYPNQALVLSQLQPGDFVLRYSYGSTSHYEGKIIFSELDPDYRHPYFKIDEALTDLKPHADGTPKASKYVSSYRILEHVDIDAIKSLYLCNADGTHYKLQEGPYTPPPPRKEGEFNIFVEVNPLTMITLSKYNMRDFGRWFTGGNEFLSVPRLFYMEMNFNLSDFMDRFKQNPFAPSPLVGVHPSKLRDAILDLEKRTDKYIKGLTLHNALTRQTYRAITTGLMFMDAEKEKFFPMPPLEEIEERNFPFYRGM